MGDIKPIITVLIKTAKGDLAYLSRDVRVVDQADEFDVFSRTIIVNDAELVKDKRFAPREKRRKIERRAPQVGVNIRYEDKDKEPGFEPKRIRRGKYKKNGD